MLLRRRRRSSAKRRLPGGDEHGARGRGLQRRPGEVEPVHIPHPAVIGRGRDIELGVEVIGLEVLLHAAGTLGRVGRRQDEVGHGVGRVGGRVEAEVAAVAGEADAERHLAHRRWGEVVHGGPRDEAVR